MPIFIVRVECERLKVVQKHAELASAKAAYEKLRKFRPSGYLLLDYDPAATTLGKALYPDGSARWTPRPSKAPRIADPRIPQSAARAFDIRAVLLRLEYAAFCCRVARTTRMREARKRSIQGARDAVRDAKYMAGRMEMSEGETLWFRSTLAAVSSEIMNEMVAAAEE